MNPHGVVIALDDYRTLRASRAPYVEKDVSTLIKEGMTWSRAAREAHAMDVDFRVYRSMRNDLDRLHGRPYELYEKIKSDWTQILRTGNPERELDELRKALGRG